MVPPGDVVKPDSWRCIQEEGMPVHGHPYEKGNLYVHFNVVFPDTLSDQAIGLLKNILPPPAPAANGSMDLDDIETVSRDHTWHFQRNDAVFHPVRFVVNQNWPRFEVGHEANCV